MIDTVADTAAIHLEPFLLRLAGGLQPVWIFSRRMVAFRCRPSLLAFGGVRLTMGGGPWIA